MGSQTWRGDRGPPMTELGDRPGMGFVAPHCGPVMPAFLVDAALLCLRFVHVFRLCWVFPAVRLSLVVVRGVLTAEASLLAEHRL